MPDKAQVIGNSSVNEIQHSFFRKMLHKLVPANFKDIIGLTRRLLFEGKPAGRMAMLYSLGGLLLTPLDLLLRPFEQRLYNKAEQPNLPQIFVCGAPRTGTTLVAQVLMKHLPVFYFNNLTSLFPRSPIMASKLFGWLAKGGNQDITFNSFYGRTTKLSFPNDALYFWDRWTGHDRKAIPTELSPEIKQAMVSFFGAFEKYSGQPLVNKNNSLNTYAHLVADAVPNAHFICLDRDAVYLAQSHLVARRFIHGDERAPYGVRGENVLSDDPIEDICRQVLFHKKQIREEQDIVGTERFTILPYEDFCARPAHWVSFFSEKILGKKLKVNELQDGLPPFEVANKPKIEAETLKKIEQTFERLSKNII